MTKISQILAEIEDRLANGQQPYYISTVMNIPLYWVTEAEMDMDWTGYPEDFYPQEK